MGHLQKPGAFLDGHASGHLTHGGQQRQSAVGLLDGFISDAYGLTLDQCPGLGLISCQVEIGENDLPFPDQVVLRRQGFFNVHDHVSRSVDLFGGIDDVGPGPDVGVIGKAASRPGAFLHQHLVPALNHHLHSRRSHAHPILRRLDLLGYSYNHVSSLMHAV